MVKVSVPLPAAVVVMVLHIQQLCQRYCDVVDYLEDLLRRQLVAAVGRVVSKRQRHHLYYTPPDGDQVQNVCN